MTITAVVEQVIRPWREELIGVAAELVRAGWAEAGAGNISALVEPADASTDRRGKPDTAGQDEPLPCSVPELGARSLLVSVAGSRMRTIARDPAPYFGLLRISPDGRMGSWFGLSRATSELAVHLACQAALARAGRDNCRLLHTHPTALSALTRLVSAREDLLALLSPAGAENEILREQLGITPNLAPGSEELALSSAELIGSHPALVWPGHGILAAGNTLDAALDLVQLADKAAAVALATLSPAPGPRTIGRPMAPGRSLKGRPSPEGVETAYDVRTRDSLLSPADFARLPRRPLIVVLDNIRSAFNVGSVFRLADACRATRVVTCGYTAHPPHHKLEQAALGTTASVPWVSLAGTAPALQELRDEGYQLVGVETADRAIPYHRFEYRPPVAFVFGNEALGLSNELLSVCDGVVDIPVAGYKNSINVATAAGIVMYDLCRRQGWLEPD